MTHRNHIYDAVRALTQSGEFRQECSQEQVTIVDHCLAGPELPSDEQMHRALRIVGRVYACGD